MCSFEKATPVLAQESLYDRLPSMQANPVSKQDNLVSVYIQNTLAHSSEILLTGIVRRYINTNKFLTR